jgi:hypothetical protein
MLTTNPTIDVDVSIELWEWKDRANGPVKEVATYLVALATSGISAEAALVKYPLLPSSCIHDLKVLSNFDFIEGGQLFCDENHSDKNRISIVHLMAKLR